MTEGEKRNQGARREVSHDLHEKSYNVRKGKKHLYEKIQSRTHRRTSMATDNPNEQHIAPSNHLYFGKTFLLMDLWERINEIPFGFVRIDVGRVKTVILSASS